MHLSRTVGSIVEYKSVFEGSNSEAMCSQASKSVSCGISWSFTVDEDCFLGGSIVEDEFLVGHV